MVDIKVPAIGESITEVTLVKWLKKDGEYVERDDVIAELESEKATFEVNAEKAGILKTVGKEGDTLKIGDVVARIDESAANPEKKAAEKTAADNGVPSPAKKAVAKEVKEVAQEAMAKHPVVQEPPGHAASNVKATPVAAAIITDKKVDKSSITPSGANG